MLESKETLCECCGATCNVDDMTNTDNGLLCQSCVDEYYTHCDACGELTHKDDIIETADGDSICPRCKDDDYFKCAVCGEIHHKDESHYVDCINGDVCDSCIDDFAWCDDCECYVHAEDVVYIEDLEKWVCKDCAEKDYYKCDDCGNWYSYGAVRTDSHDNVVCNQCYEYHDWAYCEQCEELIEASEQVWIDDVCFCQSCAHDCAPKGLHLYSHKPKPKFYNCGESSKLYTGPENELSFADTDDRNEALWIIQETLNDGDDDEPVVYCKQDASLSNGLEMVWHPRTLNSWLALRPDLENCFARLRELTDGLRDGLHVHISRKHMSMAHKVRFGSFFAAYKDEIEIVARRPECHWASYGCKPTTGEQAKSKGECNSDRYQAVNWRNADTVEVRVFRSTLNVNEFLAAHEFCWAAYQFTKNHCSIVDIVRKPLETWQAFLAYIQTDTRYRDLVDFLRASFEKRIANNDTLSGGRLQVYLAQLTAKDQAKGNKARKRMVKVA